MPLNTIYNIYFDCETTCPEWARPFIMEHALAFFKTDLPLPFPFPGNYEDLGEERLLKIEKYYKPHPLLTYVSYKIPIFPGDIWSEWIIVAIAFGVKG